MSAPAAFDVAIAGLGAMGSAVAVSLARRGLTVAGFDRGTPPHEEGSSHGATRIIREAYFEHPAYVPLVQQAYALWNALERESGTALLQPTGGLMIGRPDSELIEGTLRSADLHRLPHEVLGPAAVCERHPAMRLAPDMIAVWEPRAGILQPEACLRVQLALAQRLGARLGFDEPLLHWEADAAGVRLQTARRELRARQLVLCAGAWTNGLLPGAMLPLQVERQTLHWFEPLEPSALAPARCPIHLWQFDGDHFFYGFPDLGDGAKAAFHHGGEITSVAAVRRDVQPAEVEAVRAVMRRFMPAADGPLRRSQVCLYTNTPDGHFWIDRLERHPAVIVVSACSGHGFKFAPAIGELVADRVQERPSRLDASLFGRR